MKRTFLSALFLFFACIVNCQTVQTIVEYKIDMPNENGNLIFYNAAAKKLSINDFLGRPNDVGKIVAITSSGFSFKSAFKTKAGNTVLQMKVSCSFDKLKSWMKEEGKNKTILNHEQRHFDLSYISCIQFIQKVKQAKFNNDNIKSLLNSMYDESIEALRIMQQQYDDETNNGTLSNQQEQWNQKIDELLNANKLQQ